VITNLRLLPTDHVLPCPFCGAAEVELRNTHTAAYWIECWCSAQVHGIQFGGDVPSEKLTMGAHMAAKDSAIERWNRRAVKKNKK
jgi:hypothetical protein